MSMRFLSLLLCVACVPPEVGEDAGLDASTEVDAGYDAGQPVVDAGPTVRVELRWRYQTQPICTADSSGGGFPLCQVQADVPVAHLAALEAQYGAPCFTHDAGTRVIDCSNNCDGTFSVEYCPLTGTEVHRYTCRQVPHVASLASCVWSPL
jgi:hypothetical protein